MKIRAEQIKSGKIWQAYTPNKPDVILFEGSRNKCMQYIRISHGKNAYKCGRVRVGQLIYEAQTKT